MIIQQEQLCPNCKQVIEIIEIEKRTNVKNYKEAKHICDVCRMKSKEKHRQVMTEVNKREVQKERVSERMKQKNPMFSEETRSKVSETFKEKYKDGTMISLFSLEDFKRERKIYWSTRKISKEEKYRRHKEKLWKKIKENINIQTESNQILSDENQKETTTTFKHKWGINTEISRRKTSERMKLNNPMRNADSKAKMHRTLMDGYQSGRIKMPRGKEHWLWKGTSTFNKLVRTRLYKPFIQKVFERDNYTCVNCRTIGGILHAHHIRPLREIIDVVLNQFEINNIENFAGAEKYAMMIEEVIKEHRIEDGITLCPKCHHKIDSYYKRKTYNED